MALALGVVLGVFEVVGWVFAGPVNALSYLFWAVWLVVVGVQFLRRKADRRVAQRIEINVPSERNNRFLP